MKHLLTLGAIALTLHTTPGIAQTLIPNELIDSSGFVELVNKSQEARETNRLSEEDFLRAMQSGEYILLDARSQANYQRSHIAGAVNLPFTEFTAETLAAIIPSKSSKILIYCNNNFLNSPPAFPTKSLRASLNLNTQASLRAYGYESIYELGPALKINESILPFAGTEMSPSKNTN